MVSLLHYVLQAYCKSGLYFMSIHKIEGMSSSSHVKVIYINFLSTNVYKFNQVSKVQYIVEPEISSLVLIFCSVCNPFPGCMTVMITYVFAF